MRIATTSFLALALLGAGCNPVQQAKEKIEQNVIENAVTNASGGKVKVDAGKGQVNVSDNGTSASYGNDVVIPVDFPKEIPVYAGAKVTIVSQSQAEKTAILGLHSDDPSDAVAKWYAKTLIDGGWKEESTMNLGEMALRTYTKGDATITATFIPEYSGKNGTTINLSLKNK